jgi:sigma-B regulation protein RsbU (phosphoserine phosphatase)
LLGELLYSNEPTVINDLDQRLREEDPAIEYLRGYKLLATLPQYDNGVALNMSAILLRDPARFPMEQYPVFVWQSNLWGRATLNLVLRKELTSAYEALDRELHVVGEMQKALLPAELPVIPGLQVAAHYETSTRAGGDYYDFFDLGNGRWGVLIADVSGHGTPAAVIMAITHAISHLHPGCGTPPGALLEFINRSLARRYTARTNTFVTAFYGVYDANARTLTYARAGHNPPRLLRHHQVIPLDAVGNLPLGIEDDVRYEERCEPLLPGDKIILYTDGITEARNPAGEMFDTHSLDGILCRCGSARDVLDRVLGALQTFTEGKPATDDRTLLVASVGKRM